MLSMCWKLVGHFPPLPPRFLKRTVYVIAYSCALRHVGESLLSWPLLWTFLVWMYWDATWTVQATKDACVAELATALRVAAFAEGLPSRQRDERMLAEAAATDVKRHADSEGARRFAEVQCRTHCIFASRALVWGNTWEAKSGDLDQLDANLALCLPRFYRFCMEVRQGMALDAFVFEARGEQYGADVDIFARTVKRVMSFISAHDPAGVDCMRKSYLSKRGWFFQFNRESFFVTTFAPCYPASNPRYQFGKFPESCFILFQPEESFFRHDLPPDKPRSETHWDEPVDVRDRIRSNFKKHGREYKIPETTSYPPAEFIVAAKDVLNEPPVQFWASD
mmetsp:Transcript_52753/g.123379  ORF Transcript_52753/g.123379 Transcript_52753/m.123379 type:complete len:336 (-) Transcript_52753:2-1009(-)